MKHCCCSGPVDVVAGVQLYYMISRTALRFCHSTLVKWVVPFAIFCSFGGFYTSAGAATWVLRGGLHAAKLPPEWLYKLKSSLLRPDHTLTLLPSMKFYLLQFLSQIMDHFIFSR